MARLGITGDVHGKPIERFSFRKHPSLRALQENDVMVVLGDCGIPFGYNAPYWEAQFKKEELYQARWLNEKPWLNLWLCGNHDDRDAIAQMPIVEKWGGKVRQLSFAGETFDHIFIVDTPQILDINGRKCLCIPGAESHDIQDGILDPDADNFEEKYAEWRKDYYKMFRVRHWSWWDDEAVDVEEAEELIADAWAADENLHFDYIFTHDCPALGCTVLAQGFRLAPTKGEEFLETVRRTVSFDAWFHGHMHQNRAYPEKDYRYKDPMTGKWKEFRDVGDDRVCCLYEHIVMEED